MSVKKYNIRQNMYKCLNGSSTANKQTYEAGGIYKATKGVSNINPRQTRGRALRGYEPMPQSGVRPKRSTNDIFGNVVARSTNLTAAKVTNATLLQTSNTAVEPAPTPKVFTPQLIDMINSGMTPLNIFDTNKMKKVDINLLNAMKNNNAKLITMEIIRGTMQGKKYSSLVEGGGKDNNARASQAYQKLVTQYSNMVTRGFGGPSMLQGYINEFERTLKNIYGERVYENAPLDKLRVTANRLANMTGALQQLIAQSNSDGADSLASNQDIQGLMESFEPQPSAPILQQPSAPPPDPFFFDPVGEEKYPLPAQVVDDPRIDKQTLNEMRTFANILTQEGIQALFPNDKNMQQYLNSLKIPLKEFIDRYDKDPTNVSQDNIDTAINNWRFVQSQLKNIKKQPVKQPVVVQPIAGGDVLLNEIKQFVQLTDDDLLKISENHQPVFNKLVTDREKLIIFVDNIDSYVSPKDFIKPLKIWTDLKAYMDRITEAEEDEGDVPLAIAPDEGDSSEELQQSDWESSEEEEKRLTQRFNWDNYGGVHNFTNTHFVKKMVDQDDEDIYNYLLAPQKFLRSKHLYKRWAPEIKDIDIFIEEFKLLTNTQYTNMLVSNISFIIDRKKMGKKKIQNFINDIGVKMGGTIRIPSELKYRTKSNKESVAKWLAEVITNRGQKKGSGMNKQKGRGKKKKMTESRKAAIEDKIMALLSM